MTKQTRRALFAAVLSAPVVAVFHRPAKCMTRVEIQGLNRLRNSLMEASRVTSDFGDSLAAFARDLDSEVWMVDEEEHQ